MPYEDDEGEDNPYDVIKNTPWGKEEAEKKRSPQPDFTHDVDAWRDQYDEYKEIKPLYIELQSIVAPKASSNSFVPGDDPFIPTYDERFVNRVRHLAKAVRENNTNSINLMIKDIGVSPNIRLGGDNVNSRVLPMGIIWYQRALKDIKDGREVNFAAIEELLKLGHDPRIPMDLGNKEHRSLLHIISDARIKSEEGTRINNQLLSSLLDLCIEHIPDFSLDSCYNFEGMTPPIIAGYTGNTGALKIYEMALNRHQRLFYPGKFILTDNILGNIRNSTRLVNMVDLAVIESSKESFDDDFWETLKKIIDISPVISHTPYNSLCLALVFRNKEALPHILEVENVDLSTIDSATSESYLDIAARIFFDDYNNMGSIWSYVAKAPRTFVNNIFGWSNADSVDANSQAFELAQRSFSNLHELHERIVGMDISNIVAPDGPFEKYMIYQKYYERKMGFNQEKHLNR